MIRRLLHKSTALRCEQTSSQRVHSREHTGDGASDEEIKSRVLETALLFVPDHGWSEKSIQLGAQKEGLPPVAHGMFPRGGIELVNYFYATCDGQMVGQMRDECARVEQGKQAKGKTSVFIYDNVQTRLSMIVPYINSWHQAMALRALPQNALDSWKQLHYMCDDIWYYAGDRSLDLNYYTKRGSLAAIYKCTELHMLQDSSPDYQDSWSFLNRRMEDLTTVGQSLKQIRQGSAKFGGFAYSACITAQNILGMNDRNR